MQKLFRSPKLLFIVGACVGLSVHALTGNLALFGAPVDYVVPTAHVAPSESLNVKKARELLQNLGGANFKKDQVKIKEINIGMMGGEAVIEAEIETSFRARNKDGKWRLAEIRLGDRQWESLDLVEEAIRREKIRRTTALLKELAEGISTYQRERGQFVESEKISELLDFLSPRYLANPHRFDLWGEQFEYHGKTGRYRLSSAGPDRKSGTKDDLIIENGSMRLVMEQ